MWRANSHNLLTLKRKNKEICLKTFQHIHSKYIIKTPQWRHVVRSHATNTRRSSTCRSNHTVARDRGVCASVCCLLRRGFRFRVSLGVCASGVAGHRRHGVFHPVQRDEHQREHQQQQAHEQTHVQGQTGQRGGGASRGRHGGARWMCGGEKTRRRRRRRSWWRWWWDKALPYDHHFNITKHSARLRLLQIITKYAFFFIKPVIQVFFFSVYCTCVKFEPRDLIRIHS